jgi:glutamine phosphoribosylpyrophosphate amidotransferase
MCEHYVARAASPFQIEALFDFTAKLERFGIAGFGWGASWLAGDGRLRSYRDVVSFADDSAGRAEVGRQPTTSLLVHLRRPSKLSTLGMPDTQPFDDPAGRFAFSHNGDLRRVRELRNRYRAAGRIHGKADSEVGARWLEDAWPPVADVPQLLESLHETFGGHANLAVVTATGETHHYAGNDENPVFTFRLGEIGLASTGIYSLDRSLFTFVAPAATERRMVGQGATASLGADGSARTNRPSRRTLVATA